MSVLLHEILLNTAATRPESEALRFKDDILSYAQLAEEIERFAGLLCALGLEKQQRVGVYLPKQPETVTAFFAATEAGGVFVPINPLLKAPQVEHILKDCSVRILITSKSRLAILEGVLNDCEDLTHVVLVDEASGSAGGFEIVPWDATGEPPHGQRVVDTDMAAILYTSGSTGKPKGVVLSHANMVVGAYSVAEYLENRPDDRLLCVLPFSFDYGFSQLSTAFTCGACAVLLEYLLPRDVVTACARHQVTGLAAVPPLWVQLARLDWPDDAATHLRYLTNSGGAMPRATLQRLREKLPETKVFLMYGLTEAFRSTYLRPERVVEKPESIGRAIPNAEILVVREDGTHCEPGEAGELVHLGPLVAMGYWNDAERTAKRFRPVPGRKSGTGELAVWSGDTVRFDEDGDLYFVGRRDDMIKTSGYRVSPSEIEEVAYDSNLVNEACAIGPAHPELGQAIVLIATPAGTGAPAIEELLRLYRQSLPTYMVPKQIVWCEALPRNPNGKLDRKAILSEHTRLFQESAA